jgi:hypothetical protein
MTSASSSSSSPLSSLSSPPPSLSSEFAAVRCDLFSETPSVRRAALEKLWARCRLHEDLPVDDSERASLLPALPLPVVERLVHLFRDPASEFEFIGAANLLSQLCSMHDGLFAHVVAEAGAAEVAVLNLCKNHTQAAPIRVVSSHHAVTAKLRT